MKYNKDHLKGIAYFILSIICGAINDILAKHICFNMPPMNVAFFRFLFTTLTLVPVIFLHKSSLQTNRYDIHIIRGLLFFIGIACWIYGVKYVNVAVATTISFTIPIFTLIIGSFALKENITPQRWIATFLGLIGIIIIINPNTMQFDLISLIFLFASIIFASLDIINKIFIVKETVLGMMFYSSLVTTAISLFFVINSWVSPSVIDLFWFIAMGLSSNLLLFFILRAFKLCPATVLAPYRYFELIITSISGYLLFGEIITMNLVYGAIIIIFATLFISYSDANSIE